MHYRRARAALDNAAVGTRAITNSAVLFDAAIESERALFRALDRLPERLRRSIEVAGGMDV
jgi:hypothetical protein